MRLTDLNPSFVGAGGPGITNSSTGEPVPRRDGVGLAFDCPCGCGSRTYIPFENPIDGMERREEGWHRTGDTFDTLTLSPSILRTVGCKWHGWIRDGDVVQA